MTVKIRSPELFITDSSVSGWMEVFQTDTAESDEKPPLLEIAATSPAYSVWKGKKKRQR